MTRTISHDAIPNDRAAAVARALARAFLAGDIDAPALRARGARTLGRKWPWLGRLVRRLLDDFGEALQPWNHDEIVQAILDFPVFRAAFEFGEPAPQIKGHSPFHEAMGPPAQGLERLPVPPLDTPGDLARWLGITAQELDWFADIGGWNGRSRSEPLRHYRYRWLPKASGGVRLLEVPKLRLRDIQRRILREILPAVPLHGAAHGCVPQHSALTNAALHVGNPVVLRLDLADFFAGIREARVRALFQALGYPPGTSRYLAALTTHCAPRAVTGSVPLEDHALPEARRERRLWAQRFSSRHLPQGAPTSPALANLCAYRLDLRLAGAATSAGAAYTRYVDDLFFSGKGLSADRASRFAQMVYGIIIEEGFEPNARKTRVMPQGQAQHVTGLVVNERPNVPRAEYDRLKAILTNCIRHGPHSQNRASHPDFRAHLLGRVSHVLHANPGRGARLMSMFEAISWKQVAKTSP